VADLYVVSLTIFDPDLGSERVVRYGTKGFVTRPTETPRNVFVADVVESVPRLRRTMFRDGATFGRSQQTLSTLTLLNGDGDLDFLRRMGCDGRDLVVERGAFGAAYPSGFTTVLVATMQYVDVGTDEVTVTFRDRALALEVPFQPNRYAGDNVLPAGLEGVAGDLEGKPKPRCFGVAKNVPAPCVNTSKLIYQVNDGPVDSVDMVYDSGIALQGRGDFVARTGGFTGDIYALAFANSLFMAVGASGCVGTSPDGITWTQQTTGGGAGITWRGVAFGAGLWVAVGHAGTLYSSPDGITWTSRTSAFGASNIYSLVYGAGQFVAVGEAGKIATSPDGITWTARTSLGGAVTINCVAQGGSYFVLGTDTGVIYTSTDAITWTSRTSASGDSVKNITWAQGLYIAVGGNGTGGNARISTSVDALIWYDRPNPFGTTQLWCVGWGPGEFLVGGTGKIGLSSDGLTWSEFTNPLGASIVYDVVFGDVDYGTSVIVGATNKVSTTYASAGSYADEDELLDDSLAPAPARYKVHAAGGYIRLGSVPAGLITCDVTEGDTAADRTHAQIFARVLSPALPLTTMEFSPADVAALDVLDNDEVGFWTMDDRSIGSVVDELAQSARAWWGPDATGVLRIAKFVAPTGSTVLDLTDDDNLSLQRIPPNDEGKGVPRWKTVLQYARNYAVQATDVAAGVTDARRAEIAKEWRTATSSDATVQTAHLLAPDITSPSWLSSAADAQTEADARQAIWGSDQDVFEVLTELNTESEAVDMGDEVNLTSDRFDLTAGEACVVLGLEPRPDTDELSLTLWRTT
jgi:hypothetical protein